MTDDLNSVRVLSPEHPGCGAAPISGELYDTFVRDLRDVVMKDAFS